MVPPFYYQPPTCLFTVDDKAFSIAAARAHVWQFAINRHIAWNHRRAVAQPCVNGNRLSQGEWQNLTPRRSETPEPIDTKFETGDNVHETTPCAKFRANPSIGGFSANGWNISKIFLVYMYLFLLTDLQVRPPGGFSHAMAWTMRPHARVKPFREPKF